MYIRCSWLSVVLTLSWLAHASSHTNPSNNLLLDQLTKSCPSDGIPVCGIRDKQLVLFSNGCLLNEANKDILQSEKIFRKVPLQNCKTGCKFSCLDVYEPVCARNIKNYQKLMFRNQCELMKYICKTDMDYFKISPYECLPTTYSQNLNKLQKRSQITKEKEIPVSCINVFRPVCGSYMGVKSSFKNECLLNAENVDFNRDWRIVNYGMCPEDYSKARRSKDSSTNLHLIEKRSYRNNLYNHAEYSANNFVDNKNDLNVPPNDLYVYMSPAYQTQFLNHDASTYQHSMPDHKTYNEILNKIATFSPTDMSFPVEEHKKEIEQSTISPLPFVVNRMNLNFFSDQNSANDIKRQSIPPAMESFNTQDKKDYYYAFANMDPTIETEDFKEIPTTATEIPENRTAPSISTNIFGEQNQLNGEKVTGKKLECKFGSVAICAALADGTTRTFETICEMMTANVYFKNTWTKLHEGTCEDCKYNCSRDYQPVCVTRNGANYTMVNECYYNMAICMDKKSKWQKLNNNECERYTRIPDKYVNTKPGFPYTSNYFISETTSMPSTDSLTLDIVTSTHKSLKVKSSKSKKLRTNSKRANFKRAISSHKCCTELTEGHMKCECESETTETPSTTESHIMRLVKERGN